MCIAQSEIRRGRCCTYCTVYQTKLKILKMRHSILNISWQPCTSCMVDIIVAMTSMTVSETMIRSVKLSTLNQNVKNPTDVMMNVWSSEFVTWYSMLRRNTNLTMARLMLFDDVTRISSSSMLYSVRVRGPEVRIFVLIGFPITFLSIS